MTRIFKDADEIMRVVTEIIFPFLLVFGIYVVLNGHISAGGGFSGGTVLGATLILLYVSFGSRKVRSFFNFETFVKASSFSLLFYGLSKAYSFITGAAGIKSIIPIGTPGNLISAGLILPLNIAVGIVVTCTIYGLFALFDKGEF